MGEYYWVVIGGLGYWGRNLVRNFERLGQVAVVDLDGSAATTSLDFFPDLEDVDGVIIATPPHTHCVLALDALEQCPNAKVLIEKPMVLSEEECARLEPHQDRIMVDHTFLFVPEFNHIKKILDSGDLGKPLYAESQRLNLGKFQDCGVVWDLAPHDLALFQWLFGCVPSVQSSLLSRVRYDQPDVARIDLLYGDVITHLHLSWLHHSKVRETTIVCEGGMISYDMMRDEQVKVYYPGKKVSSRDTTNYGDYLMGYRGGDIVSPSVKQHEPLLAMAQEFMAFCDGASARSGFDLGRDVVTALHGIEEMAS